jgi:hypothetical protein
LTVSGKRAITIPRYQEELLIAQGRPDHRPPAISQEMAFDELHLSALAKLDKTIYLCQIGAVAISPQQISNHLLLGHQS